MNRNSAAFKLPSKKTVEFFFGLEINESLVEDMCY